jgi:hypothetical protein
MSQLNLLESCEMDAVNRKPLLRLIDANRMLVTVIAGLIPIVALGALIARYSVNVPFADEWVETAVLKGFSHFPTLKLLFSQHSEHRLAVTRLILYVTASISGGDLRFCMVVTFAIAIFASIMAMVLLRRTLGDDRSWQVWWVAINFLILSPVQYSNWFWAIQNQCIVSIACLLSGLVAIQVMRSSWMQTLLCMFLALIAAFSMTNGLMVAVLLPIAAVMHSRRESAARLAAWGVFILVLFIGFFHGWKRPTFGAADPNWCIHHPIIVAEYILAFLGSCVSRGLGTLVCMVVGAIVLITWLGQCAYIVIHRRDRELVQKAIPWILVGVFAIASAVMATSGRARMGVSQAQASRYTTTSVQMWVSAIALWAILGARLPVGRLRRGAFPICGLVVVGLLGSFFIAQVVSVFELRREWAVRLRGQAGLELMNYPNSDALLLTLDPIVPDLRGAAINMNNLGRLQPPILPPDHFDSVISTTAGQGDFQQSAVQADGSIQLRGSAHLPSGRPADCVVITRGDATHPSVIWMTPVAISKPEIAEISSSGASPGSWTASIPTQQLFAENGPLLAWAFDATTRTAYRLAESR